MTFNARISSALNPFLVISGEFLCGSHIISLRTPPNVNTEEQQPLDSTWPAQHRSPGYASFSL